MSSARITAAARALCRQASIECNVDEADNWKTHSEMFIEDARAAIEAADAALPPAPPKPRKKHEMSLKRQISMQERTIESLSREKIILESTLRMQETTLRIYRERHGPIGVAR